jgi:hypothetical protein
MNSKSCIALILLLFIAFSIEARVLSGHHTVTTNEVHRPNNSGQWKVFGGFTFSSLWDTDDRDTSDKKLYPIFYLGASYPYTVSDILLIEPGVRYITKGEKWVYSNWWGYGNATYTYSTSYLDIFCKFKPNNIAHNNIKIEPFIGLSVALAVREGFKFTATDWTDKGTDWFANVWDYRTPLDITIPIGVDFNINQSFVVGYELNLGLVGILKGNHRDPNPKIISQIFSLGYLF